ncbi:unnamed protein product [Prunus brigantina]
MIVSPLNFGHGGIVHAFTAMSLCILCLGLTKWDHVFIHNPSLKYAVNHMINALASVGHHIPFCHLWHDQLPNRAVRAANWDSSDMGCPHGFVL